MVSYLSGKCESDDLESVRHICLKGWTVSVLGFSGHTVSEATQLRRCYVDTTLSLSVAVFQ